MLQRLFRKLPTLILVVAAALIMALAPALAQEDDADGDVEDVSVFYEELLDYGHWEKHHEWGYVWVPDDVPDDWRPYTQGYWTYTDDQGWYWESDEPWAWIVYHYGRWGYDEELGWFWVPGRKWAPAWVVWRWSDEFVGWAPLPPDAVWDDDGDIVYGSSFYDSPRYVSFWVFVPPVYLTTPTLRRHIHDWRRNRDVFFRTRPVTRYGRHGRRVVNRGIERREIERLTRRRIESRHLFIRKDRSGGEGPSDSIRVFRPKLKRPEHGVDPRTLRSTKRSSEQPRMGRRGPNLFAPEGTQPTFVPRPGQRQGVITGPGGGGDGKSGKDAGKSLDFGKGGQERARDFHLRKGFERPQKRPETVGTPSPVSPQLQQQQQKQFQQKQFQQQFQQQPTQQGLSQPKTFNRQPSGAGQTTFKGSGSSGGRHDGDRRGKRGQDREDQQRQQPYPPR